MMRLNDWLTIGLTTLVLGLTACRTEAPPKDVLPVPLPASVEKTEGVFRFNEKTMLTIVDESQRNMAENFASLFTQTAGFTPAVQVGGEGDIVFNHEATKRLWDFANNSKDFISQNISKSIPKYKEVAVNRTYTSNSSPVINLNISGNADRETVNALKKESENIIKKAVEMTFKTANKHANIM